MRDVVVVVAVVAVVDNSVEIRLHEIVQLIHYLTFSEKFTFIYCFPDFYKSKFQELQRGHSFTLPFLPTEQN